MIKKIKRQPDWFEQASTHSSFLATSNNERLEFLGDSVLSLVLSEYLFKTHENIDEGILSKWRSSLVNEDALQKLGRELKLDKKLKTSQTQVTDRMIASAFEAYIGAFYLTHGWLKVRAKTLGIFKRYASDHLISYSPDDFKTQLQEIVQAKHKSVPVYELILEKGPSHSRTFKSIVRIEGKLFGTGDGKSKKASEQVAAKNALVKINTAPKRKKGEPS